MNRKMSKHEVTIGMTQEIKELPEIQEQRICTSHEGGALINAAVPISLDIGIKNKLITTGKKVIIYAAENTQWQHAVLYIEW